MQEAVQPDTTAAAAPDEAGPSTGRAVYRKPPTRRRRQVSLRVILDADPGPPDGGVGAPGGGAKPPPQEGVADIDSDQHFFVINSTTIV